MIRRRIRGFHVFIFPILSAVLIMNQKGVPVTVASGQQTPETTGNWNRIEQNLNVDKISI